MTEPVISRVRSAKAVLQLGGSGAMKRGPQLIGRGREVGRVYRETLAKLAEIARDNSSSGRNETGSEPSVAIDKDASLPGPQASKPSGAIVALADRPGVVRERVKPKLWTPHDLAEYLQVNVNWIYRRSPEDAVDRIPHIRMGKLLRFDAESEEFQKWLKDHGRN